ncbi:hypothetical protein SynBIOSE41_00898 [Synechococcus sp. BIOS-E4-1]|uniref:hypothetical protein n=1 Tax=Synechococcus sp. BIOS-E4-1 TaxID=1400864 RepID=UPI0016484E47|nr:hypothetical protein [Synechococcus sp. BIOS-E4-1]QNI53425.1 hypothetical protein SynBIOSE41_00898 [Synechococcus sp. BIOS-E4-1]
MQASVALILSVIAFIALPLAGLARNNKGEQGELQEVRRQECLTWQNADESTKTPAQQQLQEEYCRQ